MEFLFFLDLCHLFMQMCLLVIVYFTFCGLVNYHASLTCVHVKAQITDFLLYFFLKVLISLDARKKLLQASLHANSQGSYHQLIEQL